AVLGFATESLPLLLTVLFLMGLQSTFFGPAKYSVLPEIVSDEELVAGNALVETGTFVAILLGTIAAGIIVGGVANGILILCVSVFLIAVIGWLVSLRLPELKPADPKLQFSWNPLTPTLQTYRAVSANRSVFLSIWGISWFWFLGASLLTILPTFTLEVLKGNEHVVTLLLALFCVGIATGSLLCEKLSSRQVELGLVPFGSIGISVFLTDLYFAAPELVGDAETLLSIGGFLSTAGGWRVCFDLALLAVFSGFYSVPLYAMIQQRTDESTRSRVIAGNNILNAFLMVVASVMLIVLYGLGLSSTDIFLVLAVLNAAVALYIYTVIPEFLLRFVVWILARLMYRVRVLGREKIPTEGPALLVCNHVSFVDWLILASVVKRPVRFVMYHGFFKLPVVGFLFRDAKVIPIAPAHEDADTLAEAFDRIAEELEAGEIVCIFPEGKLTGDGEMNPFRTGVERIVARTPVPVTPMALEGMWGSFFSRKDGKGLKRPFKRVWSRVTLNVGDCVAAHDVSAADLQSRVGSLLAKSLNGKRVG
ncbi:MAG: MFS transporter, partial [Myxococcota bacterium]